MTEGLQSAEQGGHGRRQRAVGRALQLGPGQLFPQHPMGKRASRRHGFLVVS
jgi:hypothetical protein